MADDGCAANGFPRRSLYKKEAQALHRAWYPCPPDMRAGKRYTISVSGVPVPDAPRQSDASWAAQVVDLYYNGLTEEQRADPAWDPYNVGNYERYDAEFRRRHAIEFNRWDGPGPVPTDRNAAGRRAFWRVPGRTLAAVIAHVEAGDAPRLDTPAARRGAAAPVNRWAPRRAATQASSSSSSLSSSSRSASRSAPALRTPKPEPGVQPAFAYDRQGALVINSAGRPVRAAAGRRPLPPPPKKPKKEEEAPLTLAEELRRFQEQVGGDPDEAALALAVARSKDDIPPLDDATARKWSLGDHLAITGTPVFPVDDSDDDGWAPPPANQGESGPSNASGSRVKRKDNLDWSPFDRRH